MTGTFTVLALDEPFQAELGLKACQPSTTDFWSAAGWDQITFFQAETRQLLFLIYP